MTDPASPCVAVCELNTDQTLCIGCGRTTDEIALWSCADAQQKAAIQKVARERLTEFTQTKT